MLSELRLGKVSSCAIVGSARLGVAAKLIIEIGSGGDTAVQRESEWSCPAKPFVSSNLWLGSSLSIVGRKRRIAKTLPANLDLGFQKRIWIRRLKKAALNG